MPNIRRYFIQKSQMNVPIARTGVVPLRRSQRAAGIRVEQSQFCFLRRLSIAALMFCFSLSVAAQQQVLRNV